MIFAVLSLVTAMGGYTLVGVAAFGAGYGAGALLVGGIFLVSVLATALAAASFTSKKTRALSFVALALALAPALILGGKFIENQYATSAYSRPSATDVPFAQPAPAPAPMPLEDSSSTAVNRSTVATPR